MDALKIAYGHDEYLYRMLKHNKVLFPKEGYAMVSLYS